VERIRAPRLPLVVDPLDGTTNFAHGFPIIQRDYGLEQDGEMLLGVIFDPNGRDVLRERGAGSNLNNRRIRVSGAKRLADSLVSTGSEPQAPSDVNIHFYHQIGNGDARRPPRRIAAIALGLGRLRTARAFWSSLEPLGYGRRHAAGHRSRRPLLRYDRRFAYHDTRI